MSGRTAVLGSGDNALIVLLAALSMVGALGTDTYLPSFHAIGAEFGVGEVVVQQTLSAYLAATSITVLFAGTLSDSFGRRPLVLVALVLFVIASVVAVIAPDMTTLIAARALQGVASGITAVLARAIVQDRFQGAEAARAMALVMLVFGIGPAVAPVLGGWLQASFGWQSIFVFLAAYGALLALVSHWGIPESLPREQRTPFSLRPILAAYGQTLSNRRFMLRASATGLIFIGVALHISSASAYAIGILGLDETAFGWVFIPMIGGMMCGSVLAGRLTRHVPVANLNAWGFGVMMVGTLAAAVYTAIFEVRLPFAVMPLAIYTFGLALATPGTTVMTLDLLPRARGLAASMLAFLQMLVFAAVAGFVAPLVFHSAQLLALTHLLGVLTGISLWLLAGRQDQEAESYPSVNLDNASPPSATGMTPP